MGPERDYFMNKEFPRSLLPYTLRTADAPCNFKHHGRGVVREVLGYLDRLAENDRERFIWPGVDNILKNCKRYKGKPYSKRSVEYALTFLRRTHIISRRMERPRGGVLRSGFIVTPHDSLFIRTKNLCEYGGRLKAPGRWRRDPETHSWYWLVKGAL